MNSTVKLVITIVVLAAIMVGAVLLYNKLSSDYEGDKLSVNTTVASEGTSPDDTDYTAPDFTVLDYDGNSVKLSDFKGKPVVLNFWATWCYYCKEEMPDFNKAFENYPDVQFMMVNATDGVQETMAMAKEYIETQGFDFDVFFDTNMEAVTNYRVTGFPATYFIDAEGNLVTYASGMIDYDTLVRGIGIIAEN